MLSKQSYADKAHSFGKPWQYHDLSVQRHSLTLSPIDNSPSVISSKPAIMRNVVDLPQPEGPTKTINSRSVISKLKSVTE